MQLTEENIKKVAEQIKQERALGGEHPTEDKLHTMAKERIIEFNFWHVAAKEY